MAVYENLFSAKAREVMEPILEILEDPAIFAQLFHKVLQDVRRTLNVQDDSDLVEAVRRVRESFIYSENNPPVDYSLPKNLCAFFYRYSQLSAELMDCRITQALGKCDRLMNRISLNLKKNKGTLNVVIVGSGGGTDIAGLLSAFYGKVPCQELNLTFVDIQEGWKLFLKSLVTHLRHGDFGKASKMAKECKIKVSFLCQDASVAGVNYVTALQNADLILVPRLLSILSNNTKFQVSQIVAQNMKNNAVLLFVDSPPFDFTHFGLQEMYIPVRGTDMWSLPVRGRPLVEYDTGIGQQTNALIYVYEKVQ